MPFGSSDLWRYFLGRFLSKGSKPIPQAEGCLWFDPQNPKLPTR